MNKKVKSLKKLPNTHTAKNVSFISFITPGKINDMNYDVTKVGVGYLSDFIFAAE